MLTYRSNRDLGVVSSLMSLLLGIVEKDPAGYEPCVNKVIDLLSKVRYRAMPPLRLT